MYIYAGKRCERRCLQVGPLAKLDYPAILELSTLEVRRIRDDLIHIFRY